MVYTEWLEMQIRFFQQALKCITLFSVQIQIVHQALDVALQVPHFSHRHPHTKTSELCAFVPLELCAF
jgi:hypothetical protein